MYLRDNMFSDEALASL
ncbi:hypothetical protein E2C01_090286 [Portunus trituberculatus]|uniref:Uncharacterized protein n=1 Tax=Portunus trituberculatus TaxID=210409 RepID=A0A5B7JEA6_PORTR|nr:hypothetical protein [Portunus trituberculatus]